MWGSSTKSFGSGNTAPVIGSNVKGDKWEVNNTPADTISSVAWSPNQQAFAAASWDNSVSVWEFRVSPVSINPQRQYHHSAPATCVCFSEDNTMVFSGSADGEVKAYNLMSQQAITIGKHDKMVSGIAFLSQQNLVITTGYDGKVRYWNGSQTPNPVAECQLPERIACMDYHHPFIVCSLASTSSERRNQHEHIKEVIMVINVLKNPTSVFYTTAGTLRHVIRSVSMSCDQQYINFGTAEGRSAVMSFEQNSAAGTNLSNSKDAFAFKCHRKMRNASVVQPDDKIFPVNCVLWHPNRPFVFTTAGGDGTVAFWDRKKRIKIGQQAWDAPVTAAAFSPDGTYFLVALGYDWSKGHSVPQGETIPPTKLFVLRLEESDVGGRDTRSNGSMIKK